MLLDTTSAPVPTTWDAQPLLNNPRRCPPGPSWRDPDVIKELPPPPALTPDGRHSPSFSILCSGLAEPLAASLPLGAGRATTSQVLIWMGLESNWVGGGPLGPICGYTHGGPNKMI